MMDIQKATVSGGPTGGTMSERPSVDRALGLAVARLGFDLSAVFKRDPEAAAVLAELREALAAGPAPEALLAVVELLTYTEEEEAIAAWLRRLATLLVGVER